MPSKRAHESDSESADENVKKQKEDVENPEEDPESSNLDFESSDQEEESTTVILILVITFQGPASNLPWPVRKRFSSVYSYESPSFSLSSEHITKVENANENQYTFTFIVPQDDSTNQEYQGVAQLHKNHWFVSPILIPESICDKVVKKMIDWADEAVGGSPEDIRPFIDHVLWPFELDNYGSRKEDSVDAGFEEVLKFPVIFQHHNGWSDEKLWSGANLETGEITVSRQE